MAIPSTPLIVKALDVQEMTLDELELLEPGGFKAGAFKKFLARYTNWTEVEVGRITLRELREVSEQLGAKLAEAAVPKAS